MALRSAPESEESPRFLLLSGIPRSGTGVALTTNVVILALNETRKTLIASRLQKGRSRKSKPAVFESEIAAGCGLWIEGCRQVDATGMTVPVDLLFLDASSRVIASLCELQPGSVTREIEEAVAVLELPAGTIIFSQTEPGDCIAIEAVSAEAIES